MENNLLASVSGKALLFDMDGTLTPARKKISQEMVDALLLLCEAGHLVGIVSGSPYHYIDEQLKLGEVAYSENLYLMPCNGTQLYTQRVGKDKYEQTYKATMRGYLDKHSSLLRPYDELVQNILELQIYAMRRYDMPVTGNFVSDRGSMINWSPIGRDASHEDRAAFALEDTDKNLRKHLCDCLRVRLDDSDLRTTDLALGGTTSIDIFPKGWDKTYALRHLDPGLEVWFWGDKCAPQGNDHTLWKLLQPTGRSFATTGPEETLASLKKLQAQGKI